MTVSMEKEKDSSAPAKPAPPPATLSRRSRSAVARSAGGDRSVLVLIGLVLLALGTLVALLAYGVFGAARAGRPAAAPAPPITTKSGHGSQSGPSSKGRQRPCAAHEISSPAVLPIRLVNVHRVGNGLVPVGGVKKDHTKGEHAFPPVTGVDVFCLGECVSVAKPR